MITPLGDGELRRLCAHLQRHRAESGRAGDPIFHPRSADEPLDEESLGERTRAAWDTPLSEPHWMRSWGFVEDGHVRGHLDLHGGRLAAETHRATLGMGLERNARGKGHGRALLELAIAWARRAELKWIDLGVFAHNARARALYVKAGFVENGTCRDRFRVEGTPIDDVSMVLAL